MKCPGCYKPANEGSYCTKCRKLLFDGLRILPVLSFNAPAADNLPAFQEHTKRMSISGVQLKYSLGLSEDRLELFDKGGQYIIKPVPEARHLLAITEVPENEHLTMQIAGQVFGIDTAFNALIYFNDGQAAYITRRFDVAPDGSKYLQEDFAQLTSRSGQTHGDTFKYEGTYEEIGKLIQKYVAAAIPALEKFFQLVVFNYVISNGDAHLKNFSLYRNNDGEYQLTPAYDLLSSVIHTPNESDTALSLYEGDMDSDFYGKFGCYGQPDFLELSRRLGIVEKRAARMINEFHQKNDQVTAMVQRSFLSEQVKQVYLKNISDKLQRLRMDL